MVKSNLITFLNKSDIEKMKEFFLEEFYNKELRNTDHKKTLYLSYLQILISYYSSKTSNQDLLNSNETFQSFLKESKILLDKDLFYAFISLLRIHILKKSDSDIKPPKHFSFSSLFSSSFR